jgi:hypothetical protein
MAGYADAGIFFYWLAWLADDHVLSIDIHVLEAGVPGRGQAGCWPTGRRSSGRPVIVAAWGCWGI